MSHRAAVKFGATTLDQFVSWVHTNHLGTVFGSHMFQGQQEFLPQCLRQSPCIRRQSEQSKLGALQMNLLQSPGCRRRLADDHHSELLDGQLACKNAS